jgi:ATP-binding cassette subfamily G (WHITE) protein 2
VHVNGHKMTKGFASRMLGYVLQDDLLMAMMSVRETLEFSAKLRLPQSMTQQQKEQRIDRVMTELGLNKVANSRIGDEVHRGISGGERKRVSVGLEFIREISILCLDGEQSFLLLD